MTHCRICHSPTPDQEFDDHEVLCRSCVRAMVGRAVNVGSFDQSLVRQITLDAASRPHRLVAIWVNGEIHWELAGAPR